ncbi:MAG: hypothetical protein COZ01_11415, partial [Zetaproteobacteria bacterium CG_4_10_14_0_8_um_filter_55_43]
MHRRVLGFLIALPILLFFAIWQADIKMDISAFFMAGDSAEERLVASNMQNGELSRRYLASIEQPASEESPVEFMREFRGELTRINGISRVWGDELTEQEILELLSFYLPYRYHLYTLQPETDVPGMFTAAALDARAEGIKQGLLSPEAQWVKRVLGEDPMFLISNWLHRFSGNTRKGHQFASLVIETEAAGLDTEKQQPVRQKIEDAFSRMNLKYGNRYKLEMTGVPLFAMAVQEQMVRDATLVSCISIVVMLLLFTLLFRSIWALVSVSLTLIAAATVATILTSLVFGYIHALTLALGTTLIGICIDYPIHTLVHAAGSGERATNAAKRIWPSLMLGAITTVVGYAALSFTGFPGMQQIALYAGVGILTSLLIARFILPCAIDQHARLMAPAFSFNVWLQITGKRKLKVPVIIMGVAVLLLGLPGMNWQDDLGELSPSLEKMDEKDQRIRSHMQSIEPGRFVLIHADTMEKALQTNEAVLGALQKVKVDGKLEAYYSVYPWLASQSLQQRNIRAFSEQLSSNSMTLWHEAMEKAGMRSSRLADPAIPDIAPLRLQDVAGSPAGRFIAGQHVTTDHESILTIWLGNHDANAVRSALSGMKQAEYVSQKDLINEMNAGYRNKAIEALSYGSILILLLLTLRYRSPATAIRAVAPAMLSTAIVLGCWGISGQPLGMLHLVGMLLAVSICVDYGIFFVENRAENIRLTYQAIVASALTTIAAFSCLGLAENPVLQILAWTIAPGVFLGFFLCPLLLQKTAPGCWQQIELSGFRAQGLSGLVLVHIAAFSLGS